MPAVVVQSSVKIATAAKKKGINFIWFDLSYFYTYFGVHLDHMWKLEVGETVVLALIPQIIIIIIIYLSRELVSNTDGKY